MICGSRSITDKAWSFEQINNCVSKHNFDEIVVIEGEARGIDTFARQWAERHGYKIEKYPADWSLYGRKAGFVRNEIMVKACDFCLIIWDGESHGTLNDIKLCKKLNKPYDLVIYKR